METVVEINDAANGFVWGTFGLALLIGTGLICTVITAFFQVRHLKHWWRNTFGLIRDKARIINDAGALSQFRTFCTALCAVIGTGNIAGVSTAICVGGPGAVLWMWVAAFFGMMLKYSEIVLGMFYRRRNSVGAWSGGPMYYLQDGFGSKKHGRRFGKLLAVLFCIFTVLASFGIGNMAQINKITINVQSSFLSDVESETFLGASKVNWGIGLFLMVAMMVILIGGFRRVAAVSEKIIPLMSILYILGCVIMILI
ncbi:MAG: sodium:alanine symporter family protein, partial [Eubacterium sp.]|nr:sodium:alanine symporter family protein [Eubacterium sp.]